MADNSRLVTAVSRLSLATGWLSATGLLLMLAMICYDVVMRYAFNSPTTWATELSTYALIAVALLGTAYAHREDAHIRIEVLVMLLPERLRRPLALLAAWIGLLFVVFAAWQACVMSWENYVNGTRIFSLLYTPIYLPQIPIAAGFLAFALAIVAEIHRLRAPAPGFREWSVPAVGAAAVATLLALGPRPAPALGGPVDWGSLTLALAWAASVWLWSGWRVLIGALIPLAIAAALFLAARGGGVWPVVFAQAGVLLMLLALGIRVSLALGLVGLLAIFFLLPSPAPITLAERSWDSINTFTLTAVPMFVLMGALLLRSGLSDMVFDSLVKWLGRFPGGIAHAGVGACTIFAAVSGSSLATAATMGLVACPEMLKRGYSPRLAYGSIAAGGTLGILIPPSVAMIVYGSTVGAPVATLFIAGIVPGILLMLGFMGIVFLWALVRGDAAPRSESYPMNVRLASTVQILPIALLIACVLGILYAGVATPTEAGAMGAAAAFAICALRRRLGVRAVVEVLLETVKVTSFLFIIIIGASILTYLFDYLRLPRILVESVVTAGLEPWLVMLLLSALYIALGMFIDSISMMVMTLPVIFPLVVALGFDPIWFGVVLVILMEIGLITPPVGVNLFVLRGIDPSASMKDIVYGVIPFALVMALFVVVLYVLPGIATWLPSRMA